MSKADNMLSILWLLQSEKRMTAKQLADALEINIRTVYRYIDALCASGVPIISDSGHNGGYSLLHGFYEAPLFFDLHEQKALMHAAIFAQAAGYPFGDALNQAISKLKRYSNHDQLDKLNRNVQGLDVIVPLSDRSLEGMLQELEIAIADGNSLLMEYHKGTDESATNRVIDPYGLVHWKDKWYIVAYCHLRNEIRSFRVDRIRSLAHTEYIFHRPTDFSARHFFLKTLLPDPEQHEELVSVHIHGKPQAINDLCAHWLLGHVLVERTSTDAHLKIEERTMRSIVPYFLITYGKAIKVVEPLELNERLITITSELLNYYQRM